MKYTETIENPDRHRAFELLVRMEQEYESKNPSFFNTVLREETALVVRLHAVTVLSEIGDESSVQVLGDALKKDPSSLIRHECAFSLGQMGLRSSIPYLIDAALNDFSEIVRHESAAALGAIGDEHARKALVQASNDKSEEVRGSALASLFNLDFLKYSSRRKHDAVDLTLEIEEKKKRLSQAEPRKMPHP